MAERILGSHRVTESPENTSEERTEPFSQSELDNLRDFSNEREVPTFTNVPLEDLQIEDDHRRQGVRMLLRPLSASNDPAKNTPLKLNRPVSSTYDDTQWLALRAEVATLDRPEHKVLAVTQTSRDIKFSVRIPGETHDPDGLARPPLWCEIYYDPASDNVILLNKSDVPIILCHISKNALASEPPTVACITNPGLVRALSPGTWRIKVRDVDVLDFRVLEKRQPTINQESSPEVLRNPSTLSSSGQPMVTKKRQLNPEHLSDGKRAQYYPLERTDTGDGAIVFLQPAAEPLVFPLPIGSHSKELSTTSGNKLLDVAIGDTVIVPGICELDEYHLTRREPIASTALSAVYTASHSQVLDKVITVKVLKSQPSGSANKPNTYERNLIRQANTWLSESQHLEGLQHDSIVRYYGGDARFLSLYMEHTDAPSLTAGNRWMDRADGYFLGARHDALQILRDISSALDHLHGRQLVHNDIKPANVLYSSERGAVLCDFGLSTTIQNSLVGGGTPYYVPPEFIGRKLRGTASDVWALGITMLYVLRMMPLPDMRARRNHPRPLYWQIAAINNPSAGAPSNFFGNGSPGVNQMRIWLSEIVEVRGKLDKVDRVERLVFEMLAPNPNQRIKIKTVVQQLLFEPQTPAMSASDAPSGRSPIWTQDTADATDSEKDVSTDLWPSKEGESGFSGKTPVGITSDSQLLNAYMNNFHIDLFHDSFRELPDDESIERAREKLSDLLLRFMEIIAEDNTNNPLSGVVSTFVFDNTVKITSRFVDCYLSVKNGGKGIQESELGKSPLVEIQRWQTRIPLNNYSIPKEEDNLSSGEMQRLNDDTMEAASSYDSRMRMVREFVTHSGAYRWLVTRVREVTYDYAATSQLYYISNQIRELLNSKQSYQPTRNRMGRSGSSTVFCTDWDPVSFIQEQGYSERPDIAVERAITITGVINGNTEALTCSEYLDRTWPLLGRDLMGLIKQVVCGGLGSRCSVILKDSTTLTCWIQANRRVAIEVLGALETTIEVGGAVAWMTAALRSSPGETAAFVAPVCLLAEGANDETFRINVSGKWSQIKPQDVGQCWLDLFRNPAVVLGFPIRHRHSEMGPGLEIPLGMLAALVDTRRASVFDGRVLLKGFCTLLLSTKYSRNTVYWHVVFNDDGSRISAADPRVREIAGEFKIRDYLALADIESARHVVGWCGRAWNYAGSKKATYNIGRTDLNPPAPGFAFDRVSISGGKFISLGFSGVIGKKDRPVRRGKESEFHKQLEWIEQRFVVLYDTSDKRAWLLDGLSALLHVVRASLLHRRKLGYPILFDDNDVKEAQPSFTGKIAARAVLLDSHNMGLRVYQNPDKVMVKNTQKANGEIESVTETQTTWTQFSDKIGDIYSILWNIFDHQMDESSRDGVGARIRTSPRRQLEGFDFMDVASETDPIEPKVTMLRDSGSGWVDFTRAIQAITLFGNGFGDILYPATADCDPMVIDQGSDTLHTPSAVNVQSPRTGTNLCSQWSQLPKGQDLLAVGTAELRYIMNRSPRQTKDQPFWELTKDQYWHSPDKIFEDCSCSATSGMQCDRVQVLLPTKFPRLFGRGFRSPVMPLPDNGAVVFGHSTAFPLRWGPKPKSVPSEGQPECLGATSPDRYTQSDSGLQASLGNSSRSTSPNRASNIAPEFLEPASSEESFASKRVSKMWQNIKQAIR